MGSAPSEELVRELQKDAYLALLRAIDANPHHDRLEMEGFLAKARTYLQISNEVAAQVVEILTTDRELIRQGKRPPPSGLASYPSSSLLPPGKAQRMTVDVLQEEEVSDYSDSDVRKRKGRAHKTHRPIGAPGGARPRGRPPIPGTVTRTPVPAMRQPSLNRARSMRSSGAADPHGLVGRRIWRWYPDEDPERPWVEGFLTDYDGTTNTYSILYDPNDPDKQEMVETGFDIQLANPAEYVLGDSFDLLQQYGSARLAERPQPVTVAPPAAAMPPAKRRRSAPIKIPALTPFPQAWFETAILEAGGDDLQTMLAMLEAKESELLGALEEVEMALLLGDDLEKRLELEDEFAVLCDKEAKIMAELAAIRMELEQ